MDFNQIRADWNVIVVESGDRLDPDERYVWQGVLLGFLLGRGVPEDVAMDIAYGAPQNGWEV